MRTSAETAKVSDALVKATLLLTNPAKDRTASAGRYSYRYVGLPTILDEVRPILQAHQLALTQDPVETPNGVGVVARLIHASGEWLEYGPLVIPCEDSAQARGSATTYARRYQVCAILGIAADDDDDGKQASRVPQARAEGDSAAPVDNEAQRASTRASAAPEPEPVTLPDSLGDSGAAATSEGVSGGEYGEGSTPAPPSDAPTTTLAALLEAVGGSEVKAINAINLAQHTSYRKADLQTLQPADWAAGLRQLGGTK